MKKTFEGKSERNLLYLVEFGPISEQVLQLQAVIDRLEKIVHACAQQSGWEIDSCDILPDYVAITLYVKPSINIDNLIVHLQKYSSDELIKEFVEFKRLAVNDSLWEDGYDVELLGDASMDDHSF